MGDTPRYAEQARVLRIREGDRLAVIVDEVPDEDTVAEVVEGLAAWAGLPTDRVLVLAHADVALLTGDDEEG